MPANSGSETESGFILEILLKVNRKMTTRVVTHVIPLTFILLKGKNKSQGIFPLK